MNNELNKQSKNEIKSRIINQVEKMTEDMLKEAPLLVQTTIKMNIGSVKQSINDMSDEQIDCLIDKAYTILDFIQYGEEPDELVDSTSEPDSN